MFVDTCDGDESQESSTVYTSSTIYNAFPKPVPVKEPVPEQWSQPCRPLEYHEILSATNNFDQSLVIGKGGFGKVYKGNLVIGSNSVVAAIKRLDSESIQRAPEFWAEVETLSKMRHTHIVPLIGYCHYEKEMILVYQYIPNLTLDEHLHSLHTLLSWYQRLKICLGVARALNYLHTGMDVEFCIHRDVKSSNILLNNSYEPKIVDFGLSKLVIGDQESNDYVDTQIKGTFGYLDPEYFYTGKLSTKSDVFAFGVVLLEALCRRRPIDTSVEEEQSSLVRWAQDSIKDGRMKHIIDTDIRDEISPKCLKGFVHIAERCLDNDPKHRPTMAEVVSSLESVLNLQEKTNSLSQAAGKKIFGRQVDTSSITHNDKNSGMTFEFGMPKKRKLLMLREKILQRNGFLSFKYFSTKIFQLKPNYFGSIKFFGVKELEKATNGYSQDMILGRGAQGTVYKGILQDKCVVAIKSHRILSQSRLEQLITEIVILEKINHKNVIKLLGCCFKTDSPLLVYEFVSNGTLLHLIHSRARGTGILSWDNRLRMAQELADALAYLHTYETVSVIHRDVKSANILLDENYTVKIADFGSSMFIPSNHGQVTTNIEGTPGYIDPDYFSTHRLTEKVDVYAFGVVLTELLTGKKPTDRNRDDDIRLSTYFVKETKESRLREIVDPQVLEEATNEQLSAACDLVYRCLEQLAKNRPSMKEVKVELETIRKLGKHPSVSQATRMV